MTTPRARSTRCVTPAQMCASRRLRGLYYNGRMMRALILTGLFALATSTSSAQQKTVSASNAWIVAPAAGETTTVGFVHIENPTMYDVYVVSATTDVAGKVEFERTAKTPDGKSQVVETITAPAYGAVDLTRDGVQLRLSDLKKPLKSGETVALTFSTDSGASFEVTAQVRSQ